MKHILYLTLFTFSLSTMSKASGLTNLAQAAMDDLDAQTIAEEEELARLKAQLQQKKDQRQLKEDRDKLTAEVAALQAAKAALEQDKIQLVQQVTQDSAVQKYLLAIEKQRLLAEIEKRAQIIQAHETSIKERRASNERIQLEVDAIDQVLQGKSRLMIGEAPATNQLLTFLQITDGTTPTNA